MSYPKRHLRLRPRAGVSTDLPPWTVPPEFFTAAENVVFRLGVAERADNFRLAYEPPSTKPLIIRNLQIAGQNKWVYIGPNDAYSVTGAVHTEITKLGQGTQNVVGRLSLDLLNGIPVFNNAVDEPMYWDGQDSSDFLTLPGWTATETCRFIVPFKFHLFAFGIDGPAGQFLNQVKWSDAAAPGNVPATWQPAADNEAGDAVLADGGGILISAAPLRGGLACYKSDSTYICEYIGGQEIFSFRKIFSQAGALTRHSVVDIGGSHIVVSDGDVVLQDGSSIRSLVKNRRRRYLFGQLDQANYENLFAVFNRSRGEVWICFPEAGATYCNRAMVYDIANDAWGDRELANIAYGTVGIVSDTTPDETWDADSQVWDDDPEPWNTQSFSLATEPLVLADNDAPHFWEVGRGSSLLGSVLSREDIDFNEPERFKFIRRVYIRTEADAAIEFDVRIGTRNATGESIAWGAAIPFVSTDGYINCSAMGKYISIDIRATTQTPFKITGVDIEAELRGYH